MFPRIASVLIHPLQLSVSSPALLYCKCELNISKVSIHLCRCFGIAFFSTDGLPRIAGSALGALKELQPGYSPSKHKSMMFSNDFHPFHGLFHNGQIRCLFDTRTFGFRILFEYDMNKISQWCQSKFIRVLCIVMQTHSSELSMPNR